MTSGNTLREGSGDLPPVEYTQLLQQLASILRQQNPFQLSSDKQRLIINIDNLANILASNPNLANPLASPRGVRTATVNFTPSCREKFPDLIRQIRDLLKQHLAAIVEGEANIPALVQSLTIDDLTSLTGAANSQLNLGYNFRKANRLQRQKLTIETNRPGSQSLLKLHKITITVANINQVSSQLEQGIRNHIDTLPWDKEEEREDIQDAFNDIVADEWSEFSKVRELIDTEALGRLKRHAQITYLKHLLNHTDSSDTEGVIYLRDLIRRLEIIDDYISDSNLADAECEVSYAEVRANYKNLFSRAEAFESLPIIPIIDGYLGEHTDRNRGTVEFILGVKMKLDNPVQARGGEKSFQYHLNIINPDSDEHKEQITDPNEQETFARRVLRRVFLYYFVFASPCNPLADNYDPNSELDYDPVPSFEARVLPVLRGDDDEAKKRLFRGIIRGFTQYNVAHKLAKLRTLLRNLLGRQGIFTKETYPIHISVKKDILRGVSDMDEMRNGYFVQESLENNIKEGLRYISIGQGIDQNAICQIPATITIEDMRYFQGGETEELSWKYHVAGIKMLPVLWTPDNENCRSSYRKAFPHQLVVFPYDKERLNKKTKEEDFSPSSFAYRFAWMVLAYTCLHLLLETAPPGLFVSQVRLHEGDSNQPSFAEEFIADLSKTLVHLLSEKHRSNSQGFRLNTLDPFKVRNGLSSLYSVLPKRFSLPNPTNLDKLAIIVVSARESDGRYGSKNRQNRISNMMGEVVRVCRLSDGQVEVERLTTFSYNYRQQDLFKKPSILMDTVGQLYRQGYRHLLYIAEAPHTSTLHITRTDQDEELYFMSPTIIEAMMALGSDIKVYPVFCDKYYVRKLSNIKASFYVEDTEQLTHLSQDPQQQAVVFFNLFNGITVGREEERFYNGVLSYSTILGVYEGVLKDLSIREDLLDNTPLKRDILQYITLFHFSRFEKTTDLQVKLDPYDNIIGDESVGALSIFKQMSNSVEFNSLAFLTEMRNALNLR